MRRLSHRLQRELANPAKTGDRHNQIKNLVCSLRAQRVDGSTMFRLLRPNYADDVPDEEILGLIEWAEGKAFVGQRGPIRPSAPRQKKAIKPAKVAAVTAEEAIRNAESWLEGFRADLADIFHASPWMPPDDWKDDPQMLLASMYHAGERINIVSQHREGKPIGRGETRERDEWLTAAKQHAMPFSDAGAWIRMNPVDGGGVSDSNVTACRFALLENDKLPIPLQLSMLARLPLPINALVLSGGKSVHAWLRVDARSGEQYRERLKTQVFGCLARFGFDPANSNPSRLARLPGVQRRIGAAGDGEQKLIFCAPDATAFKSII
jgi:hypothetical protein